MLLDAPTSLAGQSRVQALDVGEHHQLLGAQGDGERGRRGVGVDVVHLAVDVGRDGGHDRDAAGVDQVDDRLGLTSTTSPTRPRSTSSPSTTVFVGARR